MGAKFRKSLTGLLAGLFALALVGAPTAHARAVIERAVFAADYAMPDGTLPDLCGDHGQPVDEHGQHLSAPTCFACVIMEAPGLAVPAVAVAGRIEAPSVARFDRSDLVAGRLVVSSSQRARAPPATSIA